MAGFVSRRPRLPAPVSPRPRAGVFLPFIDLSLFIAALICPYLFIDLSLFILRGLTRPRRAALSPPRYAPRAFPRVYLFPRRRGPVSPNLGRLSRGPFPYPPAPRRVAPGPRPRSRGRLPPAPAPAPAPVAWCVVGGAWSVVRGRLRVVRGPGPRSRFGRVAVALEAWPSRRGPWSLVRGPPCAAHGPRPPRGAECRRRLSPARGAWRAFRGARPRAGVAEALARFLTNIYWSKVNWLVVTNMFHVKHPRQLRKSIGPKFL